MFAPLTDTLAMPRLRTPLEHRNLEIQGPQGTLEGLIDLPADTNAIRQIAVLCHPHPLHGGTMNNKVTHSMAKAFSELGFAAIRFNFRGVGASEGRFDHGRGETDDTQAVIEWARKTYPDTSLWLGGFSFGSYTALNACGQRSDVEGLITVAPAVNLFDFRCLPLPQCPWLVVQGDQDDVVPCDDVLDWAGSVEKRPFVLRMKGAGHFFHGRLNDLRSTVKQFLKTNGVSS